MSSSTTKSLLTYAAMGVAGGGLAYYRFHDVESSKYSDYPRFRGHTSLMSTRLTESMYEGLRRVRSPSGFNLDKVIQSGVDIVGDPMKLPATGCVVADVECFDLFNDLYSGLISDIHTPLQDHVKSLSECSAVTTRVQFDPSVVQKVLIRCYRNIDDFAFSPGISRANRRQIDVAAKNACNRDMAKGTYEGLRDMPESQYKTLSSLGITFTKPSTEEDVINKITRDWPDGRSLFRNRNNDLSIWVNGRHHLEFCSYAPKGINFSAALERLSTSLNSVEQYLIDNHNLQFQWRDDLGYLGPDLKEIGTALSLEATVKLPLISQKYSFIKTIKDLKLNAIPNPEESNGIWTLALRPGFHTETEQVRMFVDAIQKLSELERNARLA